MSIRFYELIFAITYNILGVGAFIILPKILNQIGLYPALLNVLAACIINLTIGLSCRYVLNNSKNTSWTGIIKEHLGPVSAILMQATYLFALFGTLSFLKFVILNKLHKIPLIYSYFTYADIFHLVACMVVLICLININFALKYVSRLNVIGKTMFFAWTLYRLIINFYLLKAKNSFIPLGVPLFLSTQLALVFSGSGFESGFAYTNIASKKDVANAIPISILISSFLYAVIIFLGSGQNILAGLMTNNRYNMFETLILCLAFYAWLTCGLSLILSCGNFSFIPWHMRKLLAFIFGVLALVNQKVYSPDILGGCIILAFVPMFIACFIIYTRNARTGIVKYIASSLLIMLTVLLVLIGVCSIMAPDLLLSISKYRYNGL